MNTYIYKTKKYIIAQILWDLAGVICLAFSPLLQQWLFDYGLQSPLKKIVMVILAYGALLVFYTLSQYFCVLYAFKGGIKFENLLLQQWLFDYGLQSPLKKIVMANMFPYREMILQR